MRTISWNMTEKWRLVNPLQKTWRSWDKNRRKSHNGHVQFLLHCHKVSDYASPLCQWTILWSSCPPPDNAQRRSGNTLNCKETIIYNQSGLCRPTNWWMEYIPRAGYPRGLVHHWTSRRWIQHILKSLPLLEKSVCDAKLNRLTTLLCSTKACEGLLCLTHGNAEVESSLSENSKVLTSERSQLCDDSIHVYIYNQIDKSCHLSDLIVTCPHMLQKTETTKEDQDTQSILK